MGIKSIIVNTNRNIKDKGLIKTIKQLLLLAENKKELNNNKIYKEEIRKDVLFINGCDLPHPKRYRVDHQIEQLEAQGIRCDEINCLELKIKQVYEYKIFIIFRCPYTELLGRFIKEAKRNNKSTIFDIDDLIIDTKYTNQLDYVKNLSVENKDIYDDGVKRINKTLTMCDIATTTTERLRNELNNYVGKVIINRNVASTEMIGLSNKVKKTNNGRITIGYFSGSITHNYDFLEIEPVIIKVFEKYDDVQLLIVGKLDLSNNLSKYKNRIIKKVFVDYKKLPDLIASVDINLIPLQNNIFNEAKSENKWVEASLVKVVSIISNINPYKSIIKNNETGVLCSSKDEWFNKLSSLIENESLRNTLANNAYEYCLENCTTKTINNEFLATIKNLLK